MTDDRRATLEAIAYGTDARISPSDRVRAIEQLGHLPTPAYEREQLSPEQVIEELESLAETVPRMLAARGPDHVEPPVEVDDLRETLDLAMKVNDRLEARLAASSPRSGITGQTGWRSMGGRRSPVVALPISLTSAGRCRRPGMEAHGAPLGKLTHQ